MKIKAAKLPVSFNRLMVMLVLLTSFAQANADPLQGGIKEKAIGGESAINRNHSSSQSVDPFSSGEQKKDEPAAQSVPEPFATNDNFSVNIPPSGEDRRNGSGNGGNVVRGGRQGNDSRPNNNSGRPAGLTGAHPVERHPPAAQQGNQNNNVNLSKATPSRDDSENAPEMKVLWDTWHQRLAQAIYSRFNNNARKLVKNGRPMSCDVSYVVTVDHQIENIRILKSSSDPAFDNMLVSVLKSLSGNFMLQYPRGSHRQSVTRTGTFSFNQAASPGFKFQKGDTEKIQ